VKTPEPTARPSDELRQVAHAAPRLDVSAPTEMAAAELLRHDDDQHAHAPEEHAAQFIA
jgi:hypothetical protein